MHVADMELKMLSNFKKEALKIMVFIFLQFVSMWIPTQNGTFDLGSGWTSRPTLKVDL